MSTPETRRDESVVETLHGHQIADPYRWLEDPDSAETKDWVARQNEHTEACLAAMPERDWFRRTLREIVLQPRAGWLVRKGGKWFVERNDGSQPQGVWYVGDSPEELVEGGRVLFDPNTWSVDGTTSLATFSVSDDGRYVAYAPSEGGSDWQKFSVIELATGEVVDEGIVTKFSYPEWLPDNRSFLYTRYPEVGSAEGTQTDALTPGDLAVHRVGRPQSEDEVLWANPGEAMLFTAGEVMGDDRWLVVSQGWGTERTNSLWAHRITVEGTGDDARCTFGERVSIVDERTDAYLPIRVDGDELLVLSDREAPLNRVLRTTLGGDGTFTEVIAEGEHLLDSAVPAGDGFVTLRLVDVTPRYDRYAADGTHLGSVEAPGSAAIVLWGHPGEDEFVIAQSGITERLINTVVRFSTGETRQPQLVRGVSTFVAPEFTVERRRATSADGTQVPYWLFTPVGADTSKPRPTLVYGYGGFSVPVYADFRPGWAGWLKAGGTLAIANLRGGSEFGREWYDGGRAKNKQHVFDDVAAVGEHLVETGVASADTLTIHGRSNGGLLAGAALVQRPDLWKVSLPVVGVLDLLRFHKFTGGLAWASDYGNPDIAEDFEVALAYSPLHNVNEGTRYPATLVATGDHDDRVVPLHSYKFTATLQHAQAGELPILTRIETATGHGAGKPAAMLADEWADLLAFAAHYTGLHPQE